MTVKELLNMICRDNENRYTVDIYGLDKDVYFVFNGVDNLPSVLNDVDVCDFNITKNKLYQKHIDIYSNLDL